MIQRFTVNFSSIADPASVCSNPTITYFNPTGITIPCADSTSVDIEINTDVAGPYCLSFLIDCSSSCSSCGPITVTKCFCIDPDDCGGCENCTSNVCVTSCPTGKVCDNDTCVDCTNSDECLCNQICSQGVCRCEGGLKKRADGCCVECFDDDVLGNCEICVNGTIVAIICPDGVCNPNDGKCQECYNNTHCTNPNECCNEFGICDCCPGYVLDPTTNQCIPAPPCANAQDCIDQFGKCYYCTEDGCAPIVCPNGGVCDPNTGNCVPPCGVCPEGSGCINGICIPCSELSCLGEGLLCEFAVGCECNGTVCEYINCNIDTVDLQWSVSTGTPGIVVDPGQPALLGTTLITPLGLVILQPPTGASYQNHQFNLGVNGTNGTWTLFHDPATSVALGSGTSVLFDLAGTSPANGPNLVGFVVKFLETGTGRTATWAFFRTPTAPITAADVWNYEFQSTGTQATTTGGTPGSVQLCSTNGNFSPIGVTNVTTTGDINITFIPDGSQCLIAFITGCGTWNGDVVLSCGGTEVSIPAPEFVIDPSNCCDPTDPSCDGWSSGEPCGDITIQNITLVALPTYGLSGSGDGEFLFIADWASAGLSFLDLFYLNPADGCWSTNNASGGDAQIVTNNAQSPFGPSVSNLSVVATIGNGGCIRLGYTCELRIEGCKKLQGEKCLTECQAFSVDIIQTGVNTYTAAPSMSDETVTYQWTYPGLINNTGQTVAITPVGGLTTLIVVARYGVPVKCTASDSIQFNTVMPGCTNRSACNWDSTATSDDGTCVLIGTPSYNCLTGFVPGTIDAVLLSTPTIQWKIGSIILATTDKLAPDTYIVDVYINNIKWCSRTLIVPRCYNCNTGICVAAPDLFNQGVYNVSDCNNQCACNIVIDVSHNTCSNGQANIIVTATGDTGVYQVTITNPVTLLTVVNQATFTAASGYSSVDVCPGIYTVLVEGINCAAPSATVQVNCDTCTGSTLALTGVSHNCDTNYLTFTITGTPCSTGYTVQLLDTNLQLLVPPVQNNPPYTTAGTKNLQTGAQTPGEYWVRLTDNNGCVREAQVIICSEDMPLCPLNNAVGTLVDVDTTVDLTYLVNFTVTQAGGTYVVNLYEVGAGPCPGTWAPTGSPIAPPVTISSPILGQNTAPFYNIPYPTGITCFAGVVQRTDAGYEACNGVYLDTWVAPTGPPPVCSGNISNVTFIEADETISVSWNFANSSNSITLEAYVVAGVCPAIGALTITQAGLGATGTNVAFGTIPQIQGVSQCVYVKMYDTANPTCFAEFYEVVAGCACEIEIDEASVFVDPDAETIEFQYTSRCTSGVVDFDLSGGVASASGSGVGSTTGVTTTSAIIVLAISNYPSVGESSTLELLDDVDAGCGDTMTVPIPQNCVSCEMYAPLEPDFINQTTDTLMTVSAVDLIDAGTFDLTTQRVAAQADIQEGYTILGGNFCVDQNFEVQISASGVAVRPDNDTVIDLDYIETSGAEYAGVRRSYFGDCGCNTGRVCDYDATIQFTANTQAFNFRFVSIGDGNYSATVGLTKNIDMDFPPTLGQLQAFEDALIAEIGSNGCSNVLGGASVTYDNGLNQLTLSLTATDVGVGFLTTFDGATVETAVITEVEDFAQSNCV